MIRTVSAVIPGLGLRGGGMVSMGQVQDVRSAPNQWATALQPSAADAKKADVNIAAREGHSAGIVRSGGRVTLVLRGEM